MRILLIQPAPSVANRRGKRPRPLMPGLTLPLLAALAPTGVDVRIVDEFVEDLDLAAEADLVGITAMTFGAARAYEIADAFRKRAIPVVMGGFHVSALPDEAAAHCDAVVIGEADEIWPSVIEDCRRGRLEPRYEAKERPRLDRLPPPRFELLKRSGYLLPNLPVQSTRGCPHACDYCSVTRFYGRSYRHRPVDHVIRDIVDSGAKRLFIVDDNVSLDKNYARELFTALLPYKIPWFGQANISMAQDEELTDLAVRSGCRALYIGVESVCQETLDGMGKKFNRVSDYETALRAFRKAGIATLASVIFGFDTDTPRVFDDTVRFLRSHDVGMSFFNILVPMPGTPNFERLREEGRLYTTDWAKYSASKIVFEPAGMSARELKDGWLRANRSFYSLPSIGARFFLARQPNFALVLFLNLYLYGALHWTGDTDDHPLGG